MNWRINFHPFLLGFAFLCFLFMPAPAFAAMIGNCPLFSSDNIWNYNISSLPVHPNSANFINSIGATGHLHPDFGSGLYNGAPIGIPVSIVPGTQPTVPISFTYASESDPGPYPIPSNAQIEGGSTSTGDRHVIVVDSGNCNLYEIYSTYPQSNGSWQAGSGAVWNLNSNNLRPSGWTSADAAGLPILPGLVRYDEIATGKITHALRFTVASTQKSFLWPARHFASSNTNQNTPPMGLRLRLKANVDISSFSQTNRIILDALKQYGMIVADNGSNWYISGAPDNRFDNNDLHALSTIPGSDFEVVDESALQVSPDSAAVSTKTGLPTSMPALITPTFGCMGGMNCAPTVTPTLVPVNHPSIGQINPSIAVNPTTNPCANAYVSTRTRQHSKRHHKPNNGLISSFVQQLLKFILQFINLLLQLFGLSPSPTTAPLPTGNNMSPVPSQAVNPCPSSAAPTAVPTNTSNQPTNNPPAPTLTSALQPTTPVTSNSCTNPTYTIPLDPSNAQSGVSIDKYFLSADTWNSANYPLTQTVYACSYNNWYVVANMNNNSGDGAVKTSPNIHEDFNEPLISSFKTISSSFAESGPHVGIYEFEYDIWLNGVANSGSTEIMIWNDNYNQTPSGSIVATVTLGGRAYNVWKSGSYIAFVPTTVFSSGTVNLLEIFNWVISQGWIPSTSTLGQIDYGVELVSTNGAPATFKFTNFSITTN